MLVHLALDDEKDEAGMEALIRLFLVAITIIPCIEIDTPVQSDAGHIEGWAYPNARLYVRVYQYPDAQDFETTADLTWGRFYLEADLSQAVEVRVTDGIRCHDSAVVQAIHKIFLPLILSEV